MPLSDPAPREALGGARGCTHLVDLLRPIATVAYQTIWSARKRAPDAGTPSRRPPHIGRCHALRSDGEVVRERYPEWYTGD